MVVALVALAAVAAPRQAVVPSASPVGSSGLVPPATSVAMPSPSLASPVAASPSGSPTSSPPAASHAPTAPPRATGDPRLAYAEFLLRVNDDRTMVEQLNQDLSTAAQAQNTGAVHAAAVAILDFVDGERDWLREHPPATCYAAAHAGATAMLDAYGAAADRFVRWAATGGGLAGLPALSDALDAAQVASDALTAFGRALEASSCAG